ncbi:GDP-mannose 4,6 dehydratase 1 [Datura stramonium]|uniref:GDP-mannose 4,6-dehydratase n=1 Tax=Datura stramonium TaxID=4076 RepID=A0ABS8RUR2_DATST|nr:GDP-mannose 4,6 dehydratase 1 [Datura stramonium]
MAAENGSTGNSRSKIALITGITGQDDPPVSIPSASITFVDPHNTYKAKMKLHYADLSDASSLRRWLDIILPDEIYNLAAQSHVAVSFEIPDYTADVVAIKFSAS